MEQLQDINRKQSQSSLLKLYEVPTTTQATVSIINLIKISFYFGLTLLGEPQHSVSNMQKQYVDQRIITDEQFKSIRYIINKSLGLTALNLTFLIAYYKVGFCAALISSIAFAIPNIFIVCCVTFLTRNINEIVLLNIFLVGIRSASTAVVFRSAQILQNTLFTNILAGFTLVMCLLFSENYYIYFLLYLVGIVLATFSKSIKKVAFPQIDLNTSLSKPAIVIYIIIMLSLWLLAKNLNSILLTVSQLISLIMSFTLYTSYGYIAIFYGQLPQIQSALGQKISLLKMNQTFRNMLGMCFILPGSDMKIVIITCTYLFGFKGLLAGVLTVYGFSLLLICIFIKYAKILVQSRTYRKIYEGIHTVNKGFCLFFTIRSFEDESCQRQMFGVIFVVICVLLHTINPRRHMMIFLGAFVAFSRKFSLWLYRNIGFQEGICYSE